MRYTTIAETEEYSICSCKSGNSILIRKADNNTCFLNETDANILIELIDVADLNAFNTMVKSFILLDPLQEKKC